MEQNQGFFAALWSVLWCWIQQSRTYRVLRGTYDRISGSWKKSRIAGWFRKDRFSQDLHKKSIFGRLLVCPFTFLAFLNRKIGPRCAEKVEQSLILSLARGYLHGVLALNLRVLGYILTGVGVGTFVGAYLQGTLLPGWLILAVAGRILAFLDGNVTDWLKGSKLVAAVIAALGIQTEFAWYDSEEATKRASRWTGLAIGLLSGIAGGMVMPILGLLAPVGLVALFLVLEKPIVGLFVLVFLAPLAPTMAMAALSVLTMGALVIQSIIHREFRLKCDGLGFLLLGFIVVYLFAAISSFAVMKSLSIWAIYLVFLSGYFLVVNLIQSRKQLKNLLITFVFSGFLVCVYGICQYIFGWDTQQAWMDEEMFSDIKMRIYSTLDNPNVLGEYILLVLPVAIGLMWTGKKIWQKLTYGLIAGVLFVALILTFSRGCWVGLLVAAAIFVTFVCGKLWGLGLIALPMVPALLPESIVNRFTSIGDMKDSSTSYRVYIWMGTLAMVRDFWISGIGMGAEAFKSVYPFYSYNGIVAPHSHNLFLQILVESGVLGILLFVFMMAFFLKRMMTGYSLAGGKGAALATLICAISAGVCGFLVQGMFDNCFYNYRVLLIFWQVIGLGMACLNMAKEGAK